MTGYLIVGIVLVCCIGVPLIARAVMRRRGDTPDKEPDEER